MKKVLLSIFIIVICFNSFGQAIINRSGVANTVADQRLQATLNLFIPRYADTTAALSGTNEGIDSCGAIIFTYDVMAVWFRSCYNGSKQWIQILPAGSPSGQRSWLDGGNFSVLADGAGNAVWGALSNNGIKMTTNNTTRVLLDKAGLGLLSSVSDTTANKVMTFNPTTKAWNYGYWYGSGGGGSTPTWQQTLVAGSTLNQDNSIAAGQNSFEIRNASSIYTEALGGLNEVTATLGSTFSSMSAGGLVDLRSQDGSSKISFLQVHPDSIDILPYLGVLNIDTLNNETSQNNIMGWTSTSGANRGKVGYVTIGSGLSLSGGELTASGGTVTASKSVLKTGDDLTLLNDSASFSNPVKIYGYSSGVRGWKDGVITNLTNVQQGDMLTWNSDSSYFENVPDNSRYRLLQFYTGQTNAPANGDSLFYQSTFSGKWVEVYRGGENQTYNDTLNGYEFDSSTATITFHPPLTTSEKVKTYIYNVWPVIDTLEASVPMYVDLDYPTQTGLTESPSHVWSGNPANSWNNFGLSATNLPADGGYAVQYVATNGIMNITGFNLSNTSEGYPNYECGLFLSTGGTVLGMELGVPTATLATLSIGDWARMHRVGSVIKIQTSTDKVSWTDVHTFTFSSSATLYINLAIYADGGTNGKCYNPQIIIE